MGLSVKPKGFQLSYKEGKPMKYKAQLMRYPTIKSEDLIKYAANASNVPVANIESCMQGIIEAIAYFVINGHRVVLPNVGGFFLGVKSKAATAASELEVKKALKTVRVLFAPATALREDMSDNTVNMLNASIGVEGVTSGSAPSPSPNPDTNPSTVEAPVISGTTPFLETTQVTISAENGATIHYTTDGTTPTAASATYSSPVTLSNTATVSAIAIKNGVSSSVASKYFQKSNGDGDGDI